MNYGLREKAITEARYLGHIKVLDSRDYSIRTDQHMSWEERFKVDERKGMFSFVENLGSSFVNRLKADIYLFDFGTTCEVTAKLPK